MQSWYKNKILWHYYAKNPFVSEKGMQGESQNLKKKCMPKKKKKKFRKTTQIKLHVVHIFHRDESVSEIIIKRR